MKVKRITFLVISVLVTVLLTSCFGPPYRFEGYVIDFITKEPIPYAEATCRKMHVHCDENGYFDFSQSPLVTDTIGILSNVKGKNYGQLQNWFIESGSINYIPLSVPNSVYGYVELNGESNIRLEMEGETFKATAELNEAGEYTFYDVPTDEPLRIYPYKGEKRSIICEVVLKAQEGYCIYEVINKGYLQFEE